MKYSLFFHTQQTFYHEIFCNLTFNHTHCKRARKHKHMAFICMYSERFRPTASIYQRQCCSIKPYTNGRKHKLRHRQILQRIMHRNTERRFRTSLRPLFPHFWVCWLSILPSLLARTYFFFECSLQIKKNDFEIEGPFLENRDLHLIYCL